MFARFARSVLSTLPVTFKPGRKHRPRYARLEAEALEERRVLTSTLYVDFGDNFGAGLTGTIGGLQDTVAPGSNTNVNGPQMDNLTTGQPFADSDPFTMRSFNQVYGGAATLMRTTIMTLVRRFFEPLDITVVELTANNQLVNGINVRGASSLNDVSLTLDANEAAIKDNDCYVLVGEMFIGAGNYNPGNDGLVGIADIDDLLARSNLRDDTAVITLNGNLYSAELLAFGVAHEAAHNLGVRHTFGNFPSSWPGINNAIHESDIMSYLAGGTFGGLSMFSRYPMVMGDGNTSNNVLSGFPTPYDQMANDSQIGSSAVSYITGTGAHDVITVTRTSATTASVTVQAFNDAAYTSSITVPFFGGTSYSYSISTTNPLLIDGGARSDRFVIDSTLGQQVLIRGMSGDTGNIDDTDTLVISGAPASVIYEPGTTGSFFGIDGHTDYRGALTMGATVIRFQEFDTLSTIRLTGVTNVTVRSLLDSDAIHFDTTTVGATVVQRVSGLAGGFFMVPLLFSGTTNFTLDSATADLGVGDDFITVAAWVPTGLTSVTLNLGAGNDSVQLDASAASVVTNLTINADAGNDTITANAWSPTALAANIAFNVGTGNDTVTINAPFAGTMINALSLNGGDGDDRLNVNLNSLTLAGGAFISFNGGIGNDTIGVTNNVTTMTLGANVVQSSGGGQVNLTAVEAAALAGGAAANNFVLNNWNGNAATIAGGAGTDNLTINQAGVVSAVYSPSNSAVNGLSGTVALPALNIGFSQFEVGSTMTMQGAAGLAATVRTLGGVDALTLDMPAASRSRVTGTTAGAAIAPLQFLNATSFTVDMGNGDTATGNDALTVGNLVGSGLAAVNVSGGNGNDTVTFGTQFTGGGATLQNVTVGGGNGDDTVNLNLDNYGLPVGGGAFTFNGDAGTDRINVSNNVTTMTLAATQLTSSSGGLLNYTSLENAALTGGIGNNTFTVTGWNGSSLALNGGAGTDTFNLAAGNIDVIAGTVVVDAGTGAGDHLILDDDSHAMLANYTLGTTTVTTLVNTGAARNFGGVTFSSALETLTLSGTTAANTFFVTPSIDTTINIAANAGVDDLQVNFIGTGGRQITYLAGNGNWAFPGSGSPLFGVRKNVNFTSIENFNNQIAFGTAGSDAGASSAPWVKYVDLVSGEVVEFLAYESNFRGGVQVLTADVTDATGFGAPDGIPEIITAPGRGRAPEVRVFNTQGIELTRYRQMVFANNMRNGVSIAIGNIDLDPLPELIVSPLRGVVEVRVFDITAAVADPIPNAPISRFNAFAKNFIGGGSVGSGDLDNDGRSEIIVGSGSGMVATVVVFNPASPLFPPLVAPNAAAPIPTPWARYTGFFASNFKGGISSISIGHINDDPGPNIADIIVGQGQGGTSLIAMLDGGSGRRQGNGSYAATVQVAPQFAAYSGAGNRAAVYAAVRDSDGDGLIDMIFTGQASDGRTKGVIRVFKPTSPFPPGVVPIFGNAQPKGVTVG